MRRILTGGVITLGLCLLILPSALAQGDRLASPQETVRTFLGSVYLAEKGDEDSMIEAMACLDLSGISTMREEIGRKRVLQLKLIFDRINLVGQDHSKIPDSPEGGVPEGEPYVLYQDPEGEGQIELARINGEWKFSDYTVQLAIPDLVQAIRKRQADEKAEAEKKRRDEEENKKKQKSFQTVHDWIEGHVPSSMRRKAIVMEYWQWVGLGLMVLIGLAINKLSILLMLVIIIALLGTQDMEVDKPLTKKSLIPFGMLLMALFWWLGLGWLGLPPGALTVVAIGVKFVVAVAGVWGAYRLVDVVCSSLEKKAAKSVSKFDDLLVPLVRKSSKVFIVVIGLVFVVDAMGISVSGMLTGLGLGGLAFALAAQDTVKNFFGSLTVVLDRPFEVGDWVLIDKVEGAIEEVGFRSTRIRTFYQSVITIPNAKLLTAVVDNMGARRYRRWKTTIGVTYDTPPDVLDAFSEGIRELVRQGPCTRKDYFQVHVIGFAESAIEILLYVFFDTPNWSRELQEKQKMILDIMRLAESMGVDFAFPTQTLHVANGGGAAMGLGSSTTGVGSSAAMPPASPSMDAPALSARKVGRSAATALLSKQRLAKALADAETDDVNTPPADMAAPEAGSTSSAASEAALAALAGKNWPKQGEVSGIDDDDGEGDGGGEG